MRLTFLTIIMVFAVTLSDAQRPMVTDENCRAPTIREYQTATYGLIVRVYKAVAKHSNVNFAFSTLSIWIMLAAIAEGSDHNTQTQLFELLKLPQNICVRQKYYRLATTRIDPEDYRIVNTRALLLDERVKINTTWVNFVSNNSLLDVVTAPIMSDPGFTTVEIKRVMDSDVPRLKLSGNSVLLDTFDYNGLWTTAFTDAVVKRAPFYNEDGDEIGSVDLMRISYKARMGYVKYLDAQILELPCGPDNKYRMIFFKVFNKRTLGDVIKAMDDSIITQMFDSLKQSKVSIDIAIPRTEITGDIDFVDVLMKDLDITNIWQNTQATKYISKPSALPSSYVQRTTLVLSEKGLNEPSSDKRPSAPAKNIDTGLDLEVGTKFIANQPFLMGVFDAETQTPLVAVAYTTPTYLNSHGNYTIYSKQAKKV